MNQNAKKQMDAELKNSTSVAQMFDILKKYYDLENCKPGAIVKSGMIASLGRGVIFVNAKPKPQYK